MQASDDRGEQSRRAVKWLAYFELLLNFKADDAADESQWEPRTPLWMIRYICVLLLSSVTITELDMAIKQMSNNKAS